MAGSAALFASCDKAKEAVKPAEEQVAPTAGRPEPGFNWVWDEVAKNCDKQGNNCLDQVIINPSQRVVLASVVAGGSSSVAEYFTTGAGQSIFTALDAASLAALQSKYYALTEVLDGKQRFYLAHDVRISLVVTAFVLPTLEVK